MPAAHRLQLTGPEQRAVSLADAPRRRGAARALSDAANAGAHAPSCRYHLFPDRCACFARDVRSGAEVHVPWVWAQLAGNAGAGAADEDEGAGGGADEGAGSGKWMLFVPPAALAMTWHTLLNLLAAGELGSDTLKLSTRAERGLHVVIVYTRDAPRAVMRTLLALRASGLPGTATAQLSWKSDAATLAGIYAGGGGSRGGAGDDDGEGGAGGAGGAGGLESWPGHMASTFTSPAREPDGPILLDRFNIRAPGGERFLVRATIAEAAAEGGRRGDEGEEGGAGAGGAGRGTAAGGGAGAVRFYPEPGIALRYKPTKSGAWRDYPPPAASAPAAKRARKAE